MNSTVIEFPVRNETNHKTVNKASSRYRALALGLMFKCYIKPDRSLVAVLGQGNEYSNEEAILSWLLAHYSEDDIEEMSTPLDHLTHSLFQYLNNQLNLQEVVSC